MNRRNYGLELLKLLSTRSLEEDEVDEIARCLKRLFVAESDSERETVEESNCKVKSILDALERSEGEESE